MIPVQIKRKEEIAPEVYVLSFERPQVRDQSSQGMALGNIFSFEAGQFIGVGIVNSEEKMRYYSILSSPDEEILSIIFNVLPEGELTPRLAEKIPGEKIWITLPRGSFRSFPGKEIWIATGTGIAPFVSMARAEKNRRMGQEYSQKTLQKKNVSNEKFLLQGARTLEELFFYSEFQDLSFLKAVFCLSRVSPHEIPFIAHSMKEKKTSELTGEENEHTQKRGIENAQEPLFFLDRLTSFLEHWEQITQFERYLICGSPLMVQEVRELLIRKGVVYEAIVAEIYF